MPTMDPLPPGPPSDQPASVSASSASAASRTAPAPDTHRMTALERRASGTLASIYALRMLGLFLVLPVFALEAHKYPGGDDPALIGLAMGIYGLTQGLLQLPFGLASDRLGRKRTIVFGLLIFAAGSFMAAAAATLPWLIAGRALQGAGAAAGLELLGRLDLLGQQLHAMSAGPGHHLREEAGPALAHVRAVEAALGPGTVLVQPVARGLEPGRFAPGPALRMPA